MSFIIKYVKDIFYNSLLQSEYINREIDSLVIIGCIINFCVGASRQFALSKYYN